MTEREFAVAIVGMLGTFSGLWGMGYLIHTWIKSRAQGSLSGNAGHAIGEQLAQLQLSVDAMSIEIERISEAQRFTTKLLSERPDAMRIERSGATP